MRIGNDENFLHLHRETSPTGTPEWRLEAQTTSSGCRFFVHHDRLLIDASADILSQLTAFEGQHIREFELPFSEGGWLRIDRDARGHLTVRYRVARTRCGAALEGTVVIETELSSVFCRELATLLSARP